MVVPSIYGIISKLSIWVPSCWDSRRKSNENLINGGSTSSLNYSCFERNFYTNKFVFRVILCVNKCVIWIPNIENKVFYSSYILPPFQQEMFFWCEDCRANRFSVLIRNTSKHYDILLNLLKNFCCDCFAKRNVEIQFFDPC